MFIVVYFCTAGWLFIFIFVKRERERLDWDKGMVLLHTQTRSIPPHLFLFLAIFLPLFQFLLLLGVIEYVCHMLSYSILMDVWMFFYVRFFFFSSFIILHPSFIVAFLILIVIINHLGIVISSLPVLFMLCYFSFGSLRAFINQLLWLLRPECVHCFIRPLVFDTYIHTPTHTIHVIPRLWIQIWKQKTLDNGFLKVLLWFIFFFTYLVFTFAFYISNLHWLFRHMSYDKIDR